MYPILATYPLELVHVDFVTIKNPCTGKDINVLVNMDHFTHYTQAIVMTHQTVQATAKALWNNIIADYGLPTSILSDQG